MPAESSLSKRIKRHVIGRVRTYFAATSPGFENICLNELVALPLSIKAASAISGGVEFEGRLQDCCLANLNLRSANRIMLRIENFKATNFNQLGKKLFEIAWELYLRADQFPKIQVTTRHCRLHHTTAISEHAKTGIAQRLAQKGGSGNARDLSAIRQTVFVRGKDDRFTISIDSSGDNLYKRGIKKHTGKAPLRETTAAAALLLAGYTGKEPVIDPMCGSGTFALEAALMAKKIPPGWFRDFAFMTWPSFRPKRWAYLKRQVKNDFLNLNKPLIWAADADPSCCFQLENCVLHHNLMDAITVINTDFFDLVPTELTNQTGLIVINPPYGRRLGSRVGSERLLKAICDRLKHCYKGWKLALLVPDKRLAQPLSSQLSVYTVSHGGLKVSLMVGRIA